jgi:hypothetical protein
MENLKNKGVFYVAISLLGVMAIGTAVAFAYSVTKNINVAGDYINYEAAVQESEQFGAVSGPDYTWDYQVFNGLTTYVKTGGFAKGTTTLACIKNPFNATSTVDLATVNITGKANNTFALVIGTSTGAIGLTTSTVPNGILSATITGTTTGQTINNINYAVAGTYAGGSVARLVVGWNEYVCIVAGDSTTGSATTTLSSTTDTFRGDYRIRFIK